MTDRLGWFCHVCTEDKDLLSNGLNIGPNKDMNEEPSSRKRKIGPSIDCPKVNHNTQISAKICCSKLIFYEAIQSQNICILKKRKMNLYLFLFCRR